jgi:hypothetical protein
MAADSTHSVAFRFYCQQISKDQPAWHAVELLPRNVTLETLEAVTSWTARVTDVPYTRRVTFGNIRIVVWQFWGRAARAS